MAIVGELYWREANNILAQDKATEDRDISPKRKWQNEICVITLRFVELSQAVEHYCFTPVSFWTHGNKVNHLLIK